MTDKKSRVDEIEEWIADANLPLYGHQRYLIDRVRKLEAELNTATEALEKIVACDYRGNMPIEQRLAQDALQKIRGK